jgi:hypothetical protein
MTDDQTKKPFKLNLSQLELAIRRDHQPDRNYEKGGRSFYFFDLDDNVFFLSTPIYVFHKSTGVEVALTSGEFAKNLSKIGATGIYKDYFIDNNNETGTFRRFRDEKRPFMIQPFLEDLNSAITKADFEWKGPSWACFYHASFNQRPMSLITARGHSPSVIQDGIRLFVRDGHLPKEPNYLSVFPVSHPETQMDLSQGKNMSVSELKLHAVIASVEKAMQEYGENPHHRFGMSDDDPKNLEMIFKAMLILKKKYPENSFFVIHADEDNFVKEEVFLDRTEKSPLRIHSQLSLFNGP